MRFTIRRNLQIGLVLVVLLQAFNILAPMRISHSRADLAWRVVRTQEAQQQITSLRAELVESQARLQNSLLVNASPVGAAPHIDLTVPYRDAENLKAQVGDDAVQRDNLRALDAPLDAIDRAIQRAQSTTGVDRLEAEWDLNRQVAQARVVLATVYQRESQLLKNRMEQTDTYLRQAQEVLLVLRLVVLLALLAVFRAVYLSAQAEQTAHAFSLDVLNSIPAQIAILSSSGEIVAANDAWDRAAYDGLDLTVVGHCIGKNYIDVWRNATDTDPGAPRATTGLQKLLQGETDRFDHVYATFTRGEPAWYLMRAVPLQGGRSGAVVSHNDITERVNAVEQRERFYALSPDLYCILSPEGNFVNVNRAWEQTLGYSLDELVGTNAYDLIHPDDLEASQRIGLALRQGEVMRGFENRYRCRDGSYRWLEWSGVAVPGSNVVYGAARDITELMQAREEIQATKEWLEEANSHLRQLADTDGLTGLANHRAFHEVLGKMWEHASQTGMPLSLILLDVDRFKQYNDTYGHPAGDGVLKQLADILKATSRKVDIVARYGGEEFAVILTGARRAEAVEAAERTRAAIESASWPLSPITASLGLSAMDSSMHAPDDLIVAAYCALYESKQKGRNRVTCHEPALTPGSSPADP